MYISIIYIYIANCGPRRLPADHLSQISSACQAVPVPAWAADEADPFDGSMPEEVGLLGPKSCVLGGVEAVGKP